MVPDVPDVAAALPALKTGFDLVRSALGLVKDVRDALPEGEKKAAVAQTLFEAEKAVKIAEAQIAQALGYKLCQCTFPPQIMLSKGRHADGDELFVCAACSKQEPSEHHFAERANARAKAKAAKEAAVIMGRRQRIY
jgi:hypothetical protein